VSVAGRAAWLLLAGLCIGAVCLAAGPVVLAAQPISRMDLAWWRARFAAKQAELRSGPVDVIFLGDSITQDWERHGPPAWRDFAPVWQHFYGAMRAVNLGFVGDTTASLLWRERNGELDGIAPKVAVVLIGANNLGRLHWSAADTLAGIDADLAELRRRLPQTRILLLGILPSGRSAWASQTTLAVNRALAARDWRGTRTTFLDVSDVFMKDGRLDTSLFLDPLLDPPAPPLHPTAQGQARMAAAMAPVLERLLR
jgi:lysophospholipase L1-like esterase